MAKPKANMQWAPGTRLPRMNKEDGQWEYEMELIKNKKPQEERAPKEQPFHPGELVLSYDGEVVQISDVDPNGHWVMWRNSKVGTECFKKLPLWFHDAYYNLLIELGVEH